MGRIVTAAGLEKIAKHLALLTILAVIFRSWGWADTGQPVILTLAAAASALHLTAGRIKAKGLSPGSGK
ncbi:MAG: hypothetical protein PHF66_10410 [Desulfobacteraceae bacterium]|nr:hypothetical protein [Desulfobacteraceae bacterium]MDD3991720.1 hypothetical protein [Desulfobacteraceae bacterium]